MALCQHCHRVPTSHISGYCRSCRIWVAWMEKENREALKHDDNLYRCNGCDFEFEADRKPSQCPECGYQDVEKWADHLERLAEQGLRD